MAEEVRLSDAVEKLNAALGAITPYRLAVVNPGDVKHVAKNAHYMPTKVYRRLVTNIQEDGNLSSLPFCWKQDDGSFVALSGNHRVDAARDAGIGQILVLYSDAEMSREKQIAVQLSHNALVGTDNKQTLRELWEEIMVMGLKSYSGLDETSLKTLTANDLSRLKTHSLVMEDLHLLFMDYEVTRINAVIELLGKVHGVRHAAPREEWERFFEMLLTFKEAAGIINSATALLRMVEVIEEYLKGKRDGRGAQAEDDG